jgi:hypothetical protein
LAGWPASTFAELLSTIATVPPSRRGMTDVMRK